MFKEFIKNKSAIATVVMMLAFIVGFINVYPHIALQKELTSRSEDYFPYTMRGKYDMANVVGPRIREVLEGNLVVSDVDLYEYKQAPAFWPMGSAMYFYPFSFFTQSVKTVVVTTDFVFPFLYFILFFLIAYFLTGRKIVLSIFSAFIVSIYNPLAIQVPPPNLDILRSMWNTIYPLTDDPRAHYLTLRQSFIPGLVPILGTYLFLLLTLIKKNNAFPVVGGFFFALAAYTYPFHFLYLSSVFVILFVIVLISKRYDVLKRMFIFGGSATVVLTPFIVNYFEVIALSQYNDIFARYGAEEGRFFRFESMKRYLASIILAGLVFLWGRKNDRRLTSYFVISALLSAIAVLNMQLFFGFSIHPDHWLNRDIVWAITFGYIVIAAWVIQMLFLLNRNKVVSIIVSLAILFTGSVLYNNIRASTIFAEKNYQAFTQTRENTELFEWLNSNTEKEDVIMTPSLVINTYIPLHTHNNIFIPRAFNTVAPNSELLERLFITYTLYEIDTLYLQQILLGDNHVLPHSDTNEINEKTDDLFESSGSLYLFGLTYLNDVEVPGEGNQRRFITEQAANDIAQVYDTFTCEDTCLTKYRVDYLLLGPQERKLTTVSLSDNQSLISATTSTFLYGK